MNVERARRRAAKQTTGRLGAALAYQPDPADVAAWDRIEARRKTLCQDPTPMTTHNARTVGEMAARASVSAERGRLLYALTRVWNPGRVLEMGTCCGMSGAYIMAAAPAADFLSLEGSPVLADAARRLWGSLGLHGTVEVGWFETTFEPALNPAPDVVFVDGNHNEEPTVEYWRVLSAKCLPGSLLVFDDVDWSDGMRAAWRQIAAQAPESASVGGTGLVVL